MDLRENGATIAAFEAESLGRAGDWAMREALALLPEGWTVETQTVDIRTPLDQRVRNSEVRLIVRQRGSNDPSRVQASGAYPGRAWYLLRNWLLVQRFGVSYEHAAIRELIGSC